MPKPAFSSSLARTSAARPRDAATLILLRDHSKTRKTKILMGQRTTRDAWSKLYVFPGGTVDRGDHRVPIASDLRPEVAERLQLGCSATRARALAIAAIRETFEETGLLLGGPATEARFPPGADSSWTAFAERGLAPDLADLHLLCRAVTPPYRPKRFNARFFIATGDHVHDNLEGSGELHDLRWFTMSEAEQLPLPLITQTVLRVLKQRLETGSLATPPKTQLFRTIRKNHLQLEE